MAKNPTHRFWIYLAEVDSKKGAQVKKLELAGVKTYYGIAAAQFREAKPCDFLAAKSRLQGRL